MTMSSNSKRLIEIRPDLIEEWHPTKNGDLYPEDIAAYSNKKAWWVCCKGHEWEAVIATRTKGRYCPYCYGRYPIIGETDLATLCPELAKEWHSTMNGELCPQDVTVHSGKKVWWCCEKGHEWPATVATRIKGVGCPYCSGGRPWPGETDLRTVNPKLAKEWHPTLNGDLRPEDVTASAAKKVWWVCGKGHEWQATINKRSNGQNCPYCSGKRPWPGETDLRTVNPKLAKEWHPTLNGDLRPEDVTASAAKKVWWICGKGHEWRATINNRSKDKGCPYCYGRFPIKGETDFVTCYPELVEEWHPTKNGSIRPDEVACHSDRKIWWRCGENHEWQATINNRSNGRNCPYCAGNRPIRGKTDLRTVNPCLASEWHPSRNGSLCPDDVTSRSGRKIWWKCKNHHEWQATISHRSYGRNCPYCAGKRPVRGETDLVTVNPKLAAQWHPEKNGGIQPTEVTAGSAKKVWWICAEGHEWIASVSSRSNGANCPHCVQRVNQKR